MKKTKISIKLNFFEKLRLMFGEKLTLIPNPHQDKIYEIEIE